MKKGQMRTTTKNGGMLIFARQTAQGTAPKEAENSSYCPGNERCEVIFAFHSFDDVANEPQLVAIKSRR